MLQSLQTCYNFINYDRKISSNTGAIMKKEDVPRDKETVTHEITPERLGIIPNSKLNVGS